MVRESFMQLVTLLLVVSGMLLKAAARVAITMIVLWLIGVSFVYVADSWGLPQRTIYELSEDIVDLLRTPWNVQVDERVVENPRQIIPVSLAPTLVGEGASETTTYVPIDPCQKTQSVTSVLNAAYVRCGPGQNYEIVSYLLRGKTAEVIGRDAYAHWWRIRHPDAPGAETWIGSTAVNFEGDESCVPVYSR